MRRLTAPALFVAFALAILWCLAFDAVALLITATSRRYPLAVAAVRGAWRWWFPA